MSDLVELTGFAAPGAGWMTRRRERIPAPPERVWRALTDPEELRRWWCDESEVDLRPGGRFAFGGRHVFGGGGPGPVAAAGFDLLDVSPGERLVFRWPLFEVETTVVLELANVLELTELTATQTADRTPAWETGGETPDWWWVALPVLRWHVETGEAPLRLDFAALAGEAPIELAVGVSTFPWIIWHKLTAPRELDRWGARGAEVDERPGGAYSLGRGETGPTTILELDPGRRLVHDWRWAGGGSSTVEWTIDDTGAAGDATAVTVTDHGPWPPGLRRDFAAIHWASRLLDLKQLSQRGETPREYNV